MTHTRYLEVTYRHGKPFAAYLFLPREAGDRSARQEQFSEVIVIDYAADGRAIGLEIVHPQNVTEDAINQALASLNLEPLRTEDFAPLKAA